MSCCGRGKKSNGSPVNLPHYVVSEDDGAKVQISFLEPMIVHVDSYSVRKQYPSGGTTNEYTNAQYLELINKGARVWKVS